MKPPLIYLIGYMGSGKTTLGKALAHKLKYDFYDLDEEMVKSTGCSINQLFEMYGEQGFRDIERKQLLETLHYKNAVVSTGGGAPCFFDNIEQMNNAGTTIYIKMSVGGLVNRLLSAKNERPLIKDKSEDELRSFIAENLTRRELYYMEAQYSFKGENLKAEAILDTLQLK